MGRITADRPCQRARFGLQPGQHCRQRTDLFEICERERRRQRTQGGNLFRQVGRPAALGYRRRKKAAEIGVALTGHEQPINLVEATLPNRVRECGALDPGRLGNPIRQHDEDTDVAERRHRR